MPPPQQPLLYVLTVFPKLSETFVVEEILALERAGERVLIDSLEPPRDEPRNAVAEPLSERIRYVPDEPGIPTLLRTHLLLGLRRPLAWLRALRRARAEHRVDGFLRAGLVAERCRRAGARHVHTHFAYYCADVARDAAALTGLAYTVTAHANDIYTGHNSSHLARRVGPAAATLTVTEYNARALGEVAPRARVLVRPQGVRQAPALEPRPEGPILCVARLVPKKGVDLLVEALALLPDRFRLKLIGEGPMREELEALAAERELAGRVDFRGALPPAEVEQAYAGCSVVALPCRIAEDGDRDGMPLVLEEAMMRALPVVSTTIVGIPEYIEHGRTGLLVPPADPAALAAAIERLADDPGLARALGAQARETALERFEIERTVAGLRRVFDQTGEAAAP